jgi:hypothetical protein
MPKRAILPGTAYGFADLTIPEASHSVMIRPAQLFRGRLRHCSGHCITPSGSALCSNWAASSKKIQLRLLHYCGFPRL